MRLTAEQADRAAGVLLGTATGDALGAGYEFTYPMRKTVIDMVGGGAFRWEPGEWTDDTSMAIGVALAAAEVRALHTRTGLNAVAAEFGAWWDSRPKDVGSQTSRILHHRSPDAQSMYRRAKALRGHRAGTGH